MRAIVYTHYGPPEVLELREVPQPSPKANEVLIKVRAATVTAADWRMRKAEPFAARLFNGPLSPHRVTILGFELAGEVEAAGRDVKNLEPGDGVFGHNDFRFGAYAEYVCVPAQRMLAKKPMNVTWEEAAAVPFGGLAALNLLRKGGIASGQKVLVHGASGSAGTFAVQLAKHFGAEVTGICRGAHRELILSLGASQVIDYTRDDFRETGQRFDLILDAIGKMVSGRPQADFRNLLASGAAYVSVEMERKDRPQDLAFLGELLAAGALKTVIDRVYPLERLPEAHRYVEGGHKTGNVVIRVGGEPKH